MRRWCVGKELFGVSGGDISLIDEPVLFATCCATGAWKGAWDPCSVVFFYTDACKRLKHHADIGHRVSVGRYGLQIPLSVYQFPDFPNPVPDGKKLPTGLEVQAYVQAYVKNFKLDR